MDDKYKELALKEAADRLELPEEILNKVILKLLNRDLIQQVNSAFLAKDNETLRLHLHTIKGASGNVGLVGLSLFAAEAEAKLKEGEDLSSETISSITGLWNELKEKFLS